MAARAVAVALGGRPWLGPKDVNKGAGAPDVVEVHCEDRRAARGENRGRLHPRGRATRQGHRQGWRPTRGGTSHFSYVQYYLDARPRIRPPRWKREDHVARAGENIVDVIDYVAGALQTKNCAALQCFDNTNRRPTPHRDCQPRLHIASSLSVVTARRCHQRGN